MYIGLSDMMWRVFATIMNSTIEKNKKLNFYVDSILINIDYEHTLPLNRIP